MSQWSLQWPRAWGNACGTGSIRVRPEDFQVSELLGWAPSGSGEHLLVFLEKRGDNTDYVARRLAEMVGCRSMDVGFCGRKDRHALTQQWFSLPCPAAAERSFLEQLSQHWRLVAVDRDQRKLRPGQHQANRFRIRVHELSADVDTLGQRFEEVVEKGCPNYFGPQRFGHGGANLQSALELNPEKLNNRKARASAGILLSAARALMFNDWLGRRVEAGDWLSVSPGDPRPEPSGPLFGDDASGASGVLAEKELEFAAQYSHFMTLLRQTRMQAARRALVLKPLNCSLEWATGAVRFGFDLPVGSFATSVLNELLDIEDKSYTS